MLYSFRLLQGLSGGLTIPLLMVTALRALPPPIRLYGLAAYALTATFFPALSTGIAALWVDGLDWRFVFLQVIPLCALSSVLVWYGMPKDPPQYERFHKADWRGALLIVIGFGSLTTLLQQGDRLDWFNSRLICILGLLSVIAIGLLVGERVVPRAAADQAAVVGTAKPGLWRVGPPAVRHRQPVRLPTAGELPLPGAGLPAAAGLHHHRRDRRRPARPAAADGAAAEHLVGGLPSGQLRRHGLDPGRLPGRRLRHQRLEPRPVLPVAGAAGRRRAHGGHAAADDGHQHG